MISTVSLQTAKLLKENGFRQDTAFAFTESGFLGILGKWEFISIPFCFAPTTDELLAKLPDMLIMDNTQYGGKRLSAISVLVIGKPNGIFDVQYRPNKMKFKNESLCEALASMWLHLRKENLI